MALPGCRSSAGQGGADQAGGRGWALVGTVVRLLASAALGMASGLQGGFRMAQSLSHQEAQHGPSGRVVQTIP